MLRLRADFSNRYPKSLKNAGHAYMCVCFRLLKLTMDKKVNQYHYKPGQALRVPGGCGSQISKQSAHEGAKVVRLTHLPPLHQEIFLVVIYVRD